MDEPGKVSSSKGRAPARRSLIARKRRSAGKGPKGDSRLKRLTPWLLPIPVVIALTDLHGSWELAVGWVTRGERVSEQHAGLFTFEGRAGDVVVISASSAAPECQLSLYSEGRDLTTKPGSNHRLVHWLPRDDTYRVGWHPTDCENTPVVERTAPRTAQVRSLPLQVNQPALGVLEPCDSGEVDCTTEQAIAATWILEIREDEIQEHQFVSISAHSDDFDPRLVVMSGGHEIAGDDDAGPGKNPWLVLPALPVGSYEIRLSGQEFSSLSGAYEITASVFDASAFRNGAPSRGGVKEAPHLDPSWWHRDVPPLVAWTFAGEKSGVVSVTAESDDFDPFLGLFRLSEPTSSSWMASDDDIGGDTESTASRIARPLPEQATYLAVVRALGGGGGDVTVTAEVLQHASLDLDSESGKYTTNSHVRYDGKTVHAWVLNPEDDTQLDSNPVISVNVRPREEGFSPEITFYTPDGDDLPAYPGTPKLTQTAYLGQTPPENEIRGRAPLILVTAGSTGSYEIESELVRPESISPNRLYRSSLARKTYWSIDMSDRERYPSVAVLTASASQFTPCIRLVSPNGNVRAAVVGQPGEKSVELVWPSAWIRDHLVQVTANDHDSCFNDSELDCRGSESNCAYGVLLSHTKALSLDRGVNGAEQLPNEGQIWEIASAQDTEVEITIQSEVDGFVPSISIFSSGQPPHSVNVTYGDDRRYSLKRRLEHDAAHLVRVSKAKNITGENSEIPYLIRLDTTAEELIPGDAIERMIRNGHTLRVLRGTSSALGEVDDSVRRESTDTLFVSARSHAPLRMSLAGPDNEAIEGSHVVQDIEGISPSLGQDGEYRSSMIVKLEPEVRMGEYLISFGQGENTHVDTFAQVVAHWVTSVGTLLKGQQRCRCLKAGEAHRWSLASENTSVIHSDLVRVQAANQCDGEIGAASSVGPIALLNGDDFVAVRETGSPEVSVEFGRREPTRYAVVVTGNGLENTCYSVGFRGTEGTAP